jgi:hypothetical protein
MADIPANVARIDFHQVAGGWIVARFHRLTSRSGCAYIPTCRETRPDFDIDAALSWCREHGWAVREWPGGARAWKSTIEPVRSASQAERMRKDGLLLVPAEWVELGYSNIDIKYDL